MYAKLQLSDKKYFNITGIISRLLLQINLLAAVMNDAPVLPDQDDLVGAGVTIDTGTHGKQAQNKHKHI